MGDYAAPRRCLLRGGEELIMDPLFTYCANHPYHDPGKHPFPVGPIYSGGDAHGGSYVREVFRPSPDTEAVRAGAVRALTFCGQAGREALAAALEDPVAWVADEARQALG